jgi:hypothetical protein
LQYPLSVHIRAQTNFQKPQTWPCGHCPTKNTVYKNRRSRVYMGVGCCILIMAIVMAIVGTTVLGDDDDVFRETNEPTSAWHSAFFFPGTSHDLALQWIMNEDPLQLDINSTRILQRYMMVFFIIPLRIIITHHGDLAVRRLRVKMIRASCWNLHGNPTIPSIMWKIPGKQDG